MAKTPAYTNPQTLHGRLPLRTAIPLGLQHVLAMFVGNLTPLLVVMGVCQITGENPIRLSLLQNAMLVAGLITVLQLYPLGPVGSGLPIVMGTSSGFIGISRGIAVSMMGAAGAGAVGIATDSPEAGIYAYGCIMGACIIGGLFEAGLGFAIRPLRKLFPPVVTGTVVTAIGLSLIGVGIGFFGGGTSASDYGALWNLFLGLVTLIAILLFKHFCKGMASASSILLGILVGYLVSFLMGLFLPNTIVIDGKEVIPSYITKWSDVGKADWFALPSILPVAPKFNLSAILPMLLMFIVTAVETVGDTAGVTKGGLDRDPTDQELSGSVVADGVGSTVAAFFGVLPNTSFSQNVGLVGMTKVVNRFAILMGAIILMLAGLFPKIGAIINVMPQPVLGGAAVMMFSSIVISGINLITEKPLDGRNATIVTVALGLGFGLGSTAAVQVAMPQWLQYIFGGSGIVPAAVLAVILNLILPKDEKKARSGAHAAPGAANKKKR